MIEITCIECGDKFNKFQGSMDERTCTTCILKAEDPETILNVTSIDDKYKDEDYKLIAWENKNMALFLKELGYNQDQIAEICCGNRKGWSG
jgi:hypothetical protein